VKGITQKEFNANLAASQLTGKVTEGDFCFIGGDAEGQLLFETLRRLALEAGDSGTVQRKAATDRPLGFPHFFFWRTMHPDEHATATVISAIKVVYGIGKPSPTAQVEIANAKVGSVGVP
jgi:hypothetical protein